MLTISDDAGVAIGCTITGRAPLFDELLVVDVRESWLVVEVGERQRWVTSGHIDVRWCGWKHLRNLSKPTDIH